jgi:hypothetical protein
MKTAFVLPLLAMLFTAFAANAQRKRTPDSVNVIIRLQSRDAKNPRVDSVLVIFDRFDRTGAGVVKKVYHPINNVITIPQVPAGRYFISIYCLGIHRENFNDITFINKRHRNNLRYKLQKSEEYIPGTFIPVFHIDFTNLAITNVKSFR